MFEAARFFDLTDEVAVKILAHHAPVWNVLADLPALLAELVGDRQDIRGTVAPGAHLGTAPVFVHEEAVIEPGAYLLGPAYLGRGVVLRHGSYLRENCVLLDGAVLGHASEAKNSIFLPGAKAPHFNYVGDSVLGHRVNLGAGAKLGNTRVTTSGTIRVTDGDTVIDTGLRKLGAIIGDNCQLGCNSVTNPGTILGRDCAVYSNTSVARGVYPDNTILKLRQRIEVGHRENG